MNTLALVTALLLTQVTPPASLESMLSWTAPTTNEDSTPLTDLGGYLVSVAPDDVTLPGVPPIQTINITGVDLPECSDEPCVFPAFRLFEGLTPGKYRVWIQAYDTAGNFSKHSLPSAAFDLDTVAPSAPTTMAVTVKVTVEVRVTNP